MIELPTVRSLTFYAATAQLRANIGTLADKVDDAAKVFGEQGLPHGWGVVESTLRASDDTAHAVDEFAEALCRAADGPRRGTDEYALASEALRQAHGGLGVLRYGALLDPFTSMRRSSTAMHESARLLAGVFDPSQRPAVIPL